MRKFVPTAGKAQYLLIILAALLLAGCRTRSVLEEIPPTRGAVALQPAPIQQPTVPPAADTPVPTALPVATAIPAEPTPVPVQPTATLVPAAPVPLITPFPDGSNLHVVQEGESLERIGELWGISTGQIANANGITDYGSIFPGQQLAIPIDTTAPVPTLQPTLLAEPAPSESQFDPNNFFLHTVSPGETMFRIGQAYGITVDALLQYNQIDNVNLIFPGDQIRIPNR